eukprot:10457973-Karenia_brevis.AAC.1
MQLAGIQTETIHRPQAQSGNSPQGLGGMLGQKGGIKELIKLDPQEWVEGPEGLMSLGDMLIMAGYPVEKSEIIPLPPPGPVPQNYVDPPPPPTP